MDAFGDTRISAVLHTRISAVLDTRISAVRDFDERTFIHATKARFGLDTRISEVDGIFPIADGRIKTHFFFFL